MRVAPALELLPAPARGRRFTSVRTVRLGDVDPRSRLRLDTVARFLQDVATDDAADAGLDSSFGWVVRRTMIDVGRPAGLGERLRVTTFCTGSGRSWAERRTSIAGERGASVEAVSLWVQVDLATGRPAALGDGFHQIYGEAAAGRQVSTRLSLAGPADGVARRPWSVRRVDLDPFNHVNNAVHWAALEELVGGRDRIGRGEIEFSTPIDRVADVELRVDDARGGRTDAWLVAGATVHTTMRWTPTPT